VHDTGFQGFGHDITDAAGTYRFRTIKPVAYPGRTPHIHVKVLDGSRERLTTQFYLKDHPANARDVLYRRLSGAQAAAVDMVFDETQPEPVAQVNNIQAAACSVNGPSPYRQATSLNASSQATKASTTSGSNWLPRPSRMMARASAWLIAGL